MSVSSCPQMSIIFSEEDLKGVKPPCVIQSFINHNAVLYKVFVVGDSYTVVERPSLRNFPAGPAGKNSRDTGRDMNREGDSLWRHWLTATQDWTVAQRLQITQ